MAKRSIREFGTAIARSFPGALEPIAYWTLAGTCAALVTAPFVVFARNYGYGVSHLEIWLAAGLLVAVVLAAAALSRRRSLAAALIAGLLILLADIQFDGLSNHALGAVFVLSFAVAHTAIARWLLGLAFATIAVSTLATPVAVPPNAAGAASRAPTEQLPLVLHLILDEHIGPDGLPSQPEDLRDVRSELKDFYRRHGFTLFSGAYSEYFNSMRSISHALNGVSGTYDPGLYTKHDGIFEWVLTRNSYFDSLLARGYRVSVLQSDYLDLCVRPADDLRCETHTSTDVGVLRGAAVVLRPIERARVLLSAYLTRSRLYVETRTVYVRVRDRLGLVSVLPPWNWERDRTSPLSAMVRLEELIARAGRARRGEAIVAHILSPHFPYVYDRTCRVRPVDEWLNRAAQTELRTINSSSDRLKRYQGYGDQLLCLYSGLDRLVDALPPDVARDATIVIHGDHGSRITRVEPVARRESELTPEDLIDGFSTLFAVRLPQTGPAVQEGTFAIPCLLKVLSESEHRALDVDACASPGKIYLAGSPGKFVPFATSASGGGQSR